MSDLWHDPLFLAALGKRSKGGSASGDIVSFDAPRAAPLRSLLVNIDPVQAGTGDPSPYNVRPITGWTGTNVQIAGKNLIKGPFPEYTNYNGTTWRNNADGSVSVTGTPTKPAYCGVLISLPAGTYIVSGAPNNSVYGHNDILIQDINLIAIARDYKYATAETKTFTLDAPSQIRVLLRGGQDYPTNCTFYPMIQLASSAGSTYTPYSGTTIPITWQSEAWTVYGGTLDVLTGKLTVKYASETLNRVYSVGEYSNYYLWFLRPPNANPTYKLGGDTLSDIFAPHQYLPGHLWTGVETAYIGVVGPDQSLTTKEEANAWMANHPAQVVFELETPIEYTLSPQQIISSLAGENNVWADTGDVTVEWAGGKGFGKETMLAAILHGKNQ